MILYVCKYSNIMASARYRGYNWSDRLQARGYSVKVISAQPTAFKQEPFWKKLQFLLKLMVLSTQAKVLIFQKYIPPVLIQRCLQNKRIVFDFDDRIYNRDLLLNPKSRLHTFLHLTNTIIVSVQSMQAELIDCLPELAEKLVVIPTLVDLTQFNHGSAPSLRSRVVIGWIGSSPGLQYLRLIEASLYMLWQEFSTQLEFMVVCNQPYQPTQPFPVTNIPWSLEQEFDYFKRIDISIMPLDDSDRARSKAGFKAIQSLAAGVPVVASSVGFNQAIIQPGENGFLAERPEDFYPHLKRLVMDELLRDRMAQAARKSAQQYDYAVWEEVYIQHLFT